MASAPLKIGSLLAERYRVEAVLGAGGMSTVYRARDESLARSVAIKVFRETLSDATALQRQRSEVQLIASFEHPALVTLFDAVVLDEARDGEHAFLVMQFVDGDDLGAELARGTLAEDRAVAIAADIADALAYVHEQGVIHRDVKPGNLLVPRDPRATGPRALLADFGIARFLDGLALTATGSVLGTAQYLSPEQALGRELTPATDVYSLGLVLIEALSGKRAFGGAGMEAVAARISSDPALPAAASEALTALLRAMTTRDPEFRPSAAEVEQRLRALATTADLPETAAIGTEPDATVLLPVEEAAAYAPTTVMPAAASETTVLPETTLLTADVSSPVVETRNVARTRILALAAIVLVAVLAVALAVAIPRLSPTAGSTPTTSPTARSTSSSSSTSTATGTPTPSASTAPAAQSTPTAPSAPVATPSAPVATPVTGGPGNDKPGKGGPGNGRGHGKNP